MPKQSEMKSPAAYLIGIAVCGYVLFSLLLVLMASGCTATALQRATRHLEEAGARALSSCHEQAVAAGEACQAQEGLNCGSQAVVAFDVCFAEVQAKARLLKAQAEAVEEALSGE